MKILLHCEVTRSLMLFAFDPKLYCAQAALITALLNNITLFFAILNTSPYSCLHDSSFDCSLLRMFICVCFVLLSSHQCDKLSFRSNKCIFVGYSSAHNGYRCYDLITKRFRIARTSDESSISPVPVYTPSLSTSPSLPHDLFVQVTPLSSSLSVDVTVHTDTSSIAALDFSGDQHLFCRKPPRDRHPHVSYCASVNTTYSPTFSSFISTLWSCTHDKNLSLILKLQNF